MRYPRLFRTMCVIVLLGSLALGGCATYKPLPLPEAPAFATSLSALDGGGAVHLPLSETEVLRLVLRNAPTLRVAPAKRAVARAQARDAALLPNPSFSGNIGYLVSGVGDSTAWSAGLSQNIQGLVTLRARRDEADASAGQVDASVLWETWQILARARLLYVDIVAGERMLELQDRSTRLLEARADALRRAIDAGDQDGGTAAPLLVLASESRSTLDAARRKLRSQRRELSSLLGLSADAELPLAPWSAVPPVDAALVDRDLATLGRRRPDLVALRLGYAAQEARLRGAVLAQFPPLSFGYAGSRDNSHVVNGGPAVTFDLPLFDRNQGKIAIETATRQQLHDEYVARMADAVDEVRALTTEQRRVEAQVAARNATVDAALRDEARVRGAFEAGLLDRSAYTDLAMSALGRQSTALALDLATREQRIALDALTGVGMPTVLPAERADP